MLVKQLVEHRLDEQGVLLIARVQLCGGGLPDDRPAGRRESVTVSEALELRPSSTLDIGKLNLVARIDLTEEVPGVRALAFHPSARGRVRSEAGGFFFMDLLGARENMDARSRTKGLLQAVDDCDSRQLEPAERNDATKPSRSSKCTRAGQRRRGSRSGSCRRELPGDGDLDFLPSFIGQGTGWRSAADRSTLRRRGGGPSLWAPVAGLTLSFEQKLLNSPGLLRSHRP